MKEVISQVKSLVAGDLVCAEGCDASIGKSFFGENKPHLSADSVYRPLLETSVFGLFLFFQ
jgi:hypothetical protein